MIENVLIEILLVLLVVVFMLPCTRWQGAPTILPKAIKHVLLAEAQHRRLRSAFGWVRLNCLVLVITLFEYLQKIENVIH